MSPIPKVVRRARQCVESSNDSLEPRHRGFGFVTYTSAGDAQDAIDNMDLNELRGRVLRVNLARPQKAPAVGMGNRASTFLYFLSSLFYVFLLSLLTIPLFFPQLNSRGVSVLVCSSVHSASPHLRFDLSYSLGVGRKAKTTCEAIGTKRR